MDNILVLPSANGQIQLKSLAEEMQAVSKGLEKVEQELTASENDGAISAGFQKVRVVLGTRGFLLSSLRSMCPLGYSLRC